MRLNNESITNRASWQEKGYQVPTYDRDKLCETTKHMPSWIHFGAGNIFRALLANLQEDLIENGYTEKGIIAAEAFDHEIIDKVYKPYDDLSILVILKNDGTVRKRVIGSVTESLVASKTREDYSKLINIFENPSLQIASFTITEKGYSDKRDDGIISIITDLCHYRFLKGKYPIALVSMDNVSINGTKLYNAVVDMAKRSENYSDEFINYISDKKYVAFPHTMIDKITPRPDSFIKDILSNDGVEKMDIIVTNKNTYIAPFVNAEEVEYLVVEDTFPNGRPDLEKSGVIFTDQNSVDKTEKMKVSTCLNPLHTALSIFGCLLRYKTIHEEMKDNDLLKLLDIIAIKEGMLVMEDPEVIDPKAFLKEVIEVRFPNAFLKDTPNRIATDTSQKLAIRFGETIKTYQKRDDLDTSSLVGIPLVFAAWCRYLVSIDDYGNEFEISPDPRLDEVSSYVKNNNLKALLSDESIFGVNLYEVGLGEKVEGFFAQMNEENNAVRKTLHEVVNRCK